MRLIFFDNGQSEFLTNKVLLGYQGFLDERVSVERDSLRLTNFPHSGKTLCFARTIDILTLGSTVLRIDQVYK